MNQIKFLLLPVFLGMLLLLVAFFGDSLFLSVLIFLMYALLISATYSRFGIADPRVYFTPFFFVYSVWFPLQIALLDSEYRKLLIDDGYLVDVINYSFLGFYFFVIGVLSSSFFLVVERKDFWARECFFSVGKHIENVLFCIAIVCVFLTLFSGASSKREILDQSRGFHSFIVFLFVFLTAVISFRLLKNIDQWYKDFRIVFFILLSLVFMLVGGERDIFFRVLMVLALMFFDYKRKNGALVAVLIVLSAVILVPLSQAFKSILLTGELSLAELSLELILSNEFVSAGRNFYSLLVYGVEHNFIHIGNDLVRGILPSFMVDVGSTTSWFNKVYRVENDFSGVSGWGFGLVAQGFLVSGIKGVGLMMFFVGLYLGLISKLRFRSEFWYVFFVLSAAASIYCIRADLGNLISQSIKVTGLSVLLLYFLKSGYRKVRGVY